MNFSYNQPVNDQFLNNITFYELALKDFSMALCSDRLFGWDASHQASSPRGF
jgi:hypothetical protein